MPKYPTKSCAKFRCPSRSSRRAALRPHLTSQSRTSPNRTAPTLTNNLLRTLASAVASLVSRLRNRHGSVRRKHGETRIRRVARPDHPRIHPEIHPVGLLGGLILRVVRRKIPRDLQAIRPAIHPAIHRAIHPVRRPAGRSLRAVVRKIRAVEAPRQLALALLVGFALLISAAARGDTGDARSRFAEGTAAFQREDFSAALSLYEQALALGMGGPAIQI